MSASTRRESPMIAAGEAGETEDMAEQIAASSSTVSGQDEADPLPRDDAWKHAR